MLSFIPGQKLENELRILQGDIVEIYKNIEELSQKEAKYLHRFALISNIGASTRIENAVLTDTEIAWVDTILQKNGKTTAFEENKIYILDKLQKDRERSVEEVVGCRQILSTVYVQAKELFPLTEAIIRGLHHDLLRYYPRAAHFAGGYKNVPNRVMSINHKTGEQKVVLDPSPPGMVTGLAMADLVNWYNLNIHESPWPLLVATEFVFRFLAIHPFQDGNGRLGRALFILTLLQSDDKYLKEISPYIAIDRHIEQNRSLYYTTLHQCSEGKFHDDPKKYKIEPLAWFFIKILRSSLADIEVYRNRYAELQKFSESALAVLNCFKSSPEKRLKVSDIEKDTGLPRRTVQYALQTITKKAFIQKLGQGAGTRYQLIF
ncbi:MAG: Fic family protein [Deltaproteobacteria bacterium]|jgi:Fic family protein|nr:Fic family protein [Deltaproteobacteria bacterium]